MRTTIPAIHAAEAELIVVGNGTPEQAGWFAEAVKLETPIYCDPGLAVYRVMGARRGLAGVLHPSVIVRSIAALWRGFRQTGLQGDATQLGGVWVIAPGGRVLYSFRSRFAGDYPSSESYLAALPSS